MTPEPARKSVKGRRKWEPAAAMILVLLLGLWMALGPGLRQVPNTRPGADTYPVRINDTRGVIETTYTADRVPIFRVLTRDGHASADLSDRDIRAMFGDAAYADLTAPRNTLFRLLNITTWTSVVWVGVGLVGQLAFSSRFLIQWVVSERRREAVVPEAFWWMSLIGGIALFSYFVWRQDPVGVLGQSTGLVIYARNLRLIAKQRRRRDRATSTAPTVSAPTVSAPTGSPA